MMIKSLNLNKFVINKFLTTTANPKLILGIETSCDDTCAAVLDTNRNILSNEKSSQIKDVIEAGGVLTVTSLRLHSTSLHQVVLNALQKAGIKSFKELSAIAITVKPGQIVSLDSGVKYAKRLAVNYDLPLIPIHHMEAHALTAMNCFEEINFPFLALLISGGHSQIALFKSLDLIYLLGNSFDCGPGEVIDKIARLLKLKNLGKPFDQQSGGQSVEMLAKLIDKKNKFKFSNLNKKTVKNCDFNYGGMRSYFKNLIYKLRTENEQYPVNTVKPNGFKSVDIDAPLDETCFICADLQINLVNMFVDRLQKAIRFVELTNILDENVDQVKDIKLKEINYLENESINLPIVVSGGVACNDTIMYMIEQKLKTINLFYDQTKFKFFLPRPFYLCTDNATMIAWNGILKYLTNDTKYLLKTKDEIDQVKSEHDAKLGIDITHLTKRLLS